MKWQDVSSYRQDDPHPRTPHSWELHVPWLSRVVVTRHIHIEPDSWMITLLDSRMVLKGNKTADEAKQHAVELLRTRLREALESLDVAEEGVRPDVRGRARKHGVGRGRRRS